MKRKGKRLKKELQIDISKVTKHKKLPILTLDERWHSLFPDHQKGSKIRDKENKVNDLMKLQGKLVNDLKDMKVLKKKLLDEIVSNMEGNPKDLERNKRYVGELNHKIDKAMDELAELPYRIKQMNEELLLESVQDCYDRRKINKEILEDTSNRIQQLREELKEKVLEKQEMEENNNAIYTYMHDILGPELMELFDDSVVDESR